MKKTVFGLILGLFLSLGITSFAAVEFNVAANKFPIFVNGNKSDISALNVNGSTYIKLSDLKKVGTTASFDSTKKQIDITAPVASSAAAPSTANNNSGGNNMATNQLPEGASYVEFQDCKAILYNGKTFLSESDLAMKYGLIYQSNGDFLRKSDNSIIHIDLTQRANFLTVSGIIYNNKDLFGL